MGKVIAASLAAASLVSLAPPASAQGRAMTFEGNLEACPGGQQVRLEGGRRYAITATSDAFDTVVRVFRSDGGEPVAQDDDGGDGTNSRLTYAPGESGDHVVCVSSFSGGGTGAYTIGVEELGAMRPPVTEPTGTESVTRRVYDGTLADGDEQEGGSWYDDYQIRLEAGQAVVLGTEAEDLDTVLRVYRADQRGGEPIASDDDSGSDVNALLVFAAEEAGDYVVRVAAYSSGAGGAYRLRITD